jgi:hypothetical protein
MRFVTLITAAFPLDEPYTVTFDGTYCVVLLLPRITADACTSVCVVTLMLEALGM